jgi:hypothetical protein
MNASIKQVRGWAKVLAAAAASAFLLSGCGMFPEATFQLSSDSRLPRWFALPAGLARSQVTVQMDYYVPPWGRKATFTMLGPDRRVLGKVTASLSGNSPATSVGQPTLAYPSYEVVEVSGVVDIVEHRRMEPLFWMTDDAGVWKSLAPRK